MNTPSTAAFSMFRSQTDQTTAPVTIRGAVPAWLEGDLVRTAPAVFELGDWRAQHWFDGLGLMFAFRLKGGQVSFRQHLLESEMVERIKAGKADRPLFGTPTRRSLLQRLLSPIPKPTDNTNVNCVPFGPGAVLAMTETNNQHEVDLETLRTRGKVKYEDNLGARMGMTAHPHADFDRGMMVNVGTNFGRSSGYVLFEQSFGGKVRKEIARTPGDREVPYLHSFGLTPKHAVILGHPLMISPLRMLGSNRAYSQNFRWRPELGSTVHRIDRATGQVHDHHAPAMFVFHGINAFERDGETVYDVLAYDDASVVQKTSAEGLENGFAFTPKAVRIRLRHGQTDAIVESLTDGGFEFPVVDYRRYSGRSYGVAWGTRLETVSADHQATVLRLDLATGKQRTFRERDWLFGEPIFVARPGGAEGQGALLTVGNHLRDGRSALVVLEAETLDVLAWAEVEIPVPLGFHGSFVNAQSTTSKRS